MSFEIRSGKLSYGSDLACGENVIIDVDEEVTIGDRCVIPDNAYFCGRRIEIGDDFYGYSWENSRLDIGRGRRYEEYAILLVGNRCTFHNSRIDLARPVVIGNDVGLSPDVTIYTHGYWMSPDNGYPVVYRGVSVGPQTIIGYRSVILPGAEIGKGCVVGAQSVVPSGVYDAYSLYAGNPARRIKEVGNRILTREETIRMLQVLVVNYQQTRKYRNLPVPAFHIDWPYLYIFGVRLTLELSSLAVSGEEDANSDDFRDFAFKRGYRWYTKRPFKKLPGR